MTTFILACAGLVLLSGVFYLFPRARSGSTEADLDSANLEWFRLRRLELAAEGNDALDEDARLRLLEDEHLRAAHQSDVSAVFSGMDISAASGAAGQCFVLHARCRSGC